MFRKQVGDFMAMGFTHNDIAKLLYISDETLRRHYRKELDTAKIKSNFNVAKNLYNIATDPEHRSSAQAAIFWAKTQMGWREVERKEVTGANGGPLLIEGASDVIDSRSLSPDQRQALRDILTMAIAKQIEAGPKIIDVDYEVYDEGDEEDGE